jgi:hypothetical protein
MLGFHVDGCRVILVSVSSVLEYGPWFLQLGSFKHGWCDVIIVAFEVEDNHLALGLIHTGLLRLNGAI